MATFKIQRIRSCVQCGDVLAIRCKNCSKHPERKPRVVEFFGWPEILKTAECGCCIQFRCQSPNCSKPVWRYAKKNRDGLATSRAFYCSIPCSARSTAASRSKRESVPCSWCKKSVVKKSYAIKTWARAFCNKSCYFLYRAKAKHVAAESAKKEAALGMVGLLYCAGSCKEITEHITPPKAPAACKSCGARRSQFSSSINSSETIQIKNATRNFEAARAGRA